ncbi:hypothetical protein [Ferrimicrobium acidiphilum]|uniref:hypothetical protein n=1 Tax=Ferrimicrobium acidiphilum TaxID=121039 RepID=UPI0012E073B2|nr:hypothetical protein [Ferrimicrobium acidiphilum]
MYSIYSDQYRVDEIPAKGAGENPPQRGDRSVDTLLTTFSTLVLAPAVPEAQ